MKRLSEFLKITQICKSRATDIIKELTNKAMPGNYFDDVKMILELFLKSPRSASDMDKKDYLMPTLKLMKIKRTTKQVYFKKQVMDLFSKIINNAGSVKYFQGSPSRRNSVSQNFWLFTLQGLWKTF